MIGRLYSTTIGAQSQSTAKTLIEAGAASDVVMLVERAWVSQSSTDTSENSNIKIERISISGTGTDSSAAVAPLNPGDTAYSGTLETNHSIEPTYSGGLLVEQGWNILSGFLWTPANDDEVIVLAPSALVGMSLDVGITASDLSYGMTLREIGN